MITAGDDDLAGVADAFFCRPNFEITSMEFIIPESEYLTADVNEVWRKYGLPGLISSNETGAKYLMAKERYQKLSPLLSITNPWPMLYLVLAEAHFWLDDLAG